MTANILVLSFAIVLVLGLALAVVVLLWKQRQGQPPPKRMISRTVAPEMNPLLHDETVASAAGSGSANSERPGTVGRVSVVEGAPRQTHTLQPGRPVIVGRQPRQGISLQNQRVSREHARLVLANGAVQLTDLGSTNGTFVTEDKRRLAPHAPELLSPGDVFWIGPNVKLSVDIPLK